MSFDEINLDALFASRGIQFLGEKNRNRPVRSQIFDFSITDQSVAQNGDEIAIVTKVLTPLGSRQMEYQVSATDGDPDFIHKHDFYEMMYVLEGEVDVRMENQLVHYSAGDACVINRSVSHLEQYVGAFHICYLQFSTKWAAAVAGMLKREQTGGELVSFFQEEDASEDRREIAEFRRVESGFALMQDDSASMLVREMIREMENRYPGYEPMIQVLMLRLFCVLLYPALFETDIRHLQATGKDRLFEELKAYIEQTNGAVVRGELEEQLHYSADYLNRIVRRRTGMSLVTYAQNFRMQKALQLIETSDESIEAISRELGFPNKAWFYRLFKKTFQMTPVEYRQLKGKKR